MNIAIQPRMLGEIDACRGGKTRDEWIKEAIIYHLELAARRAEVTGHVGPG